MAESKKPLDQMNERELLETQVKLLSRIRSNTSNILTVVLVLGGLMILGGIIAAAS